MASVEEIVDEFIVANFLFGDTDKRLSNDDSFLEQGVIDSTGILELVSFLETTYSIKIAEHELVPENLDSIGKVAKFVSRKTAVAS